MPDAALTNPYIGPTSFTENDSDRFFGRTEETRELSSLVIARRAVLLYAQSGSGKTSLLQAALIPELKRRKRVETFPIFRVTGNADASGCLYVENALSHLFPDAPAGSFRGKTFSEAFGAVLPADTKARRQPHLVIFDQFEEIFTYHPELTVQRQIFFAQLGECLSIYPQLSLLLSMREDYLADLEAYAALLPDRLRTRMRLERLGVDGAVEAIRQPAALAGLPFADGTAEQLVDNLRRIQTGATATNGFALGLYVEPVQLQIVCRQLWSRVTADPAHRKSEIDAGDLAAHANVDHALIQFYRDSLARAQQAGVRERALRRWCGERLITPAGTRGLVYRGERDTEGLPNAAVDILRDCYIIRADLRGGTIWYELAHDRLVEPVREDNLAWRAGYRNPVAEALERGPDNLLTGSSLAGALQYARENPQELTREEGLFLRKSQEEEKKAKARRRTAIAVAAVVIVALSVLSAYAFREAQHAKASATEAQKLGTLAKDRAIAAEVQTKLADAARREAENQTALANSGRLAAAALLDKETGPDLAALLGLEGRRAADSFDARNSMLLSVQVNLGLISVIRHSGPELSVAFSPDGKMLARASGDGTVRLWDVARRQPLGDPLRGHYLSVWSVAFSPDGKMLASAGLDETVRLWDVARRQPLCDPLKGHSSSVRSVAFSPDGKLLASASGDRTVRLWDVAERRPLSGPLKGHLGYVSSVAFSPDGKVLASGSWDQTVRLWDVAERQPLGDPLTGHSSYVRSVAFSPDGQMLASAGQDQTVRLWDVASRQPLGDPLKGHSGDVWSAAFSPDGKMLASASGDQTVRLWDVAERQPLGYPLKGHSDEVFSVAFSPNSKMLASASNDHTVRLWDVAGLQRLGDPLKGHSSEVWSVAFSPDGKMLASASQDTTVWLWDVARRQPLGDPLKGHSSSVLSVAFSPDGKMLASASNDHTVRLWDVARRQALGDPLKGHSRPVASVAFSPDGKLLASASGDQTVRLWDVAGRKPLGDPLKAHSGYVRSVAFSPDGKALASANDDTVRLWDVARRQPLGGPLKGHSSEVMSVVFSPDGRMLALANADGTVRLWDVARRQPLGDPLRVHSSVVKSVAFSPDGKMLASASEGTNVWLWDVDPNSWAARLCSLANRNLSFAEWQQFIGLNVPYRRTCPAFPPGEGAPAK